MTALPPPIVVVVPAPADNTPSDAGTYRIRRTADGTVTVTGPDLPLKRFRRGAKAAVAAAMPGETVTYGGLRFGPSGPVATFLDEGAVSASAITIPGMPLIMPGSAGGGAAAGAPADSGQDGLSAPAATPPVRPKWIAVMPMTVVHGRRHWARLGNWAKTWIVPAKIDGVPLVEIAPDAGDRKRFAGLLDALGGARAAAAANATRVKYNVPVLIAALYNPQSGTVSLWHWPVAPRPASPPPPSLNGVETWQENYAADANQVGGVTGAAIQTPAANLSQAPASDPVIAHGVAMAMIGTLLDGHGNASLTAATAADTQEAAADQAQAQLQEQSPEGAPTGDPAGAASSGAAPSVFGTPWAPAVLAPPRPPRPPPPPALPGSYGRNGYGGGYVPGDGPSSLQVAVVSPGFAIVGRHSRP